MDHVETAEFKSSRLSNAGLGVGLLLLFLVCIGLPFYASEDEFLGARFRRGGFLKVIEQAIGWELFTLAMISFGLLLATWGVVYLWKAIDVTPDVTALPHGLQFHPAVRKTPASYAEVKRWNVEIVSGHPVLWLHFYKSYWSLQGGFKRKTVKLEGSKEQIEPLMRYLLYIDEMRGKFSGVER